MYKSKVYTVSIPFSGEAVKAAEIALKTNQDSTTTDEEIALLVSENLQIS